MNLHNTVRGVITGVNPDTAVSILRSSGYDTAANGKQIPLYNRADGQPANVQACSGKDVERVNSLGFQGVFRTVYLYGNVVGIVRPDGTGGDILKFSQTPGDDCQDWKCITVKETWPDWCCVIVQLQATVI
jgi:hypothetical protein